MKAKALFGRAALTSATTASVGVVAVALLGARLSWGPNEYTAAFSALAAATALLVLCLQVVDSETRDRPTLLLEGIEPALQWGDGNLPYIPGVRSDVYATVRIKNYGSGAALRAELRVSWLVFRDKSLRARGTPMVRKLVLPPGESAPVGLLFREQLPVDFSPSPLDGAGDHLVIRVRVDYSGTARRYTTEQSRVWNSSDGTFDAFGDSDTAT